MSGTGDRRDADRPVGPLPERRQTSRGQWTVPHQVVEGVTECRLGPAVERRDLVADRLLGHIGHQTAKRRQVRIFADEFHVGAAQDIVAVDRGQLRPGVPAQLVRGAAGRVQGKEDILAVAGVDLRYRRGFFAAIMDAMASKSAFIWVVIISTVLPNLVAQDL